MPEICSLATPPRLPRPFAGLDREGRAAGWWLVALSVAPQRSQRPPRSGQPVGGGRLPRPPSCPSFICAAESSGQTLPRF